MNNNNRICNFFDIFNYQKVDQETQTDDLQQFTKPIHKIFDYNYNIEDDLTLSKCTVS